MGELTQIHVHQPITRTVSTRVKEGRIYINGCYVFQQTAIRGILVHKTNPITGDPELESKATHKGQVINH